MEQRLIDANALKVSYCKQCLKETRNEQIEVKQTPYCAVACQDFDVIDKQPTVDAVPVVHAYWIIKPHGTYGQLRAFCSACEKHSGIGGIVSNQKKPYCPNCGAIMDGKEIVDG